MSFVSIKRVNNKQKKIILISLVLIKNYINKSNINKNNINKINFSIKNIIAIT